MLIFFWKKNAPVDYTGLSLLHKIADELIHPVA